MYVDRWAKHSKERPEDRGPLTVSRVGRLKLQPAGFRPPTRAAQSLINMKKLIELKTKCLS